MSVDFVEQSISQKRKAEVLDAATKDETPIGIFRLVDRMGSGMIRIGTEKLPEPDELNVAGCRVIKNVSKFRRKKPASKGGGYEHVAIRYAASTPEIELRKQDESEATINPVEDQIVFKNGEIVVVGEGKTEGLLRFLRTASENGTLNDDGSEREGRIPTAATLWIEVFPEKESEELNESVFAHAEAIEFIRKFITSKEEGNVEYDEYSLKAYARLFNVVGDKPAHLVKGLISVAQANPTQFLARAKAFEDTTLTEILHAEKLGVIRFEDTRAVYVEGNKVLATYSKHLTDDQKRKMLAGYFVSAKPNSAADYKEFTVALNVKKNQSI